MSKDQCLVLCLARVLAAGAMGAGIATGSNAAPDSLMPLGKPSAHMRPRNV